MVRTNRKKYNKSHKRKTRNKTSKMHGKITRIWGGTNKFIDHDKIDVEFNESALNFNIEGERFTDLKDEDRGNVRRLHITRAIFENKQTFEKFENKEAEMNVDIANYRKSNYIIDSVTKSQDEFINEFIKKYKNFLIGENSTSYSGLITKIETATTAATTTATTAATTTATTATAAQIKLNKLTDKAKHAVENLGTIIDRLQNIAKSSIRDLTPTQQSDLITEFEKLIKQIKENQGIFNQIFKLFEYQFLILKSGFYDIDEQLAKIILDKTIRNKKLKDTTYISKIPNTHIDTFEIKKTVNL